MKKLLSLLMVAFAMTAMVACDEKDNGNDNPGNGNGNGGDNSTLAAQLVGTWQSEHIYINDVEAHMQMGIVLNADGTGELSEKKEAISWQVDGNDVNITNSHGITSTLTVTGITESYMIVTGKTIPGSDQQVKFEAKFLKVNGNTPDPGDLFIEPPVMVENTATTLKMWSKINGHIDVYLPQFPNYTFGFVFSKNGSISMDHNVIPCEHHNPDGSYELLITGLEPGTEYTVAAWLKLTPESEPLISSTTTMSTLNDGTPDDPNWVDLGLPSGLLWATCNVGATTPEGYGNYFAWGETQPKSEYIWENCIYCTFNNDNLILTKYNPSTQFSGPVDNLTILQASDDAATFNLGNGARTPTKEEWEELNNNTTKEYATVNGVEGFRFTAANNNSIFLPFAGMMSGTELEYPVGPAGYYWSASLYTEYPSFANSFMIQPPNGHSVWHFPRSKGFSVRAVKSANK
ncbi:MAG: hypothetical protein IJK07_08045 [Bacteroidales bacterium]|nr:hypothetical protein [Bacteroidales bacterium]